MWSRLTPKPVTTSLGLKKVKHVLDCKFIFQTFVTKFVPNTELKTQLVVYPKIIPTLKLPCGDTMQTLHFALQNYTESKLFDHVW